MTIYAVEVDGVQVILNPPPPPRTPTQPRKRRARTAPVRPVPARRVTRTFDPTPPWTPFNDWTSHTYKPPALCRVDYSHEGPAVMRGRDQIRAMYTNL